MSTPTIRLQFAGQLRKIRKNLDLTQEAMAERIGMDFRYYQRLESRNPNAIKIDTIEKIGKALRLPPWKLLKF
jgi:transcriptional regulator with XRE-family HTH domain